MDSANVKPVEGSVRRKNKKKAKEKQVADVTREYLHLTASVVNMKFPRIQHISDEELINKVKNYAFYEYHDTMVQIMRTEAEKMKKAAEEEKQNKLNGQQGQSKPQA